MRKEDKNKTLILTLSGIACAAAAVFVKVAAARWIFAALAALLIVLALVADAKRRKKEKQDIENKMKFFKAPGGGSAPNNIPGGSVYAQIVARQEQGRDKLFDGQRYNAPNYGYSDKNPIMTESIPESRIYLNRLRTASGERLSWHRIGSIAPQTIHGVPSVIVDFYRLSLNGEDYKDIYVCPYGHTSAHAPRGMKLAD